MPIVAPAEQARVFRWLVLFLALAALATFAPLWLSLVLAAWAATIARPTFVRVSRALGGRGRAAGVVVAALLLALVAPLAAALASLTLGAVKLGKGLLGSSGAKGALVALVSGGESEPGAAATLTDLVSPAKVVAIVQEHGAQAMGLLGGIAGAATSAMLGLFVFFYALFVFLTDGPDYYAWLEDHAPISRAHLARLTAAFHETGRGLLVGIGLTGLLQGAVATIVYAALGVPRALVLGLLTCLATVIPSVGTALVWVPVAAGLALTGKTGSAAILVGVGVAVIGSIDNVVRPLFSRFGKLELSSFVLILSIFGGFALFGTWGFLLGPLVVRMAKEALSSMRREENGGTAA
ncbi:MAG: AI-2E family transporter [Deltaproteobacteria bacterium]|nr:AI-2E family transporter [Deltaproteobacteria bacterium]